MNLAPAAPDLTAGARIVVVRHGATRLTGRVRNGGASDAADPPLTPAARAQARRTGQVLRELGLLGDGARARSSPALRARQTAAALGWPDAPTDDRLAEVHLGAWEGTEASSLTGAITQRWWRDEGFAPPGGESASDVVRRVRPVLAACGSGTTSLLVCHLGTIVAIVRQLLGVDLAAIRRFDLPPGVVVALRVWADGGSCLDAILPPTGTIGH
ncbi:MAG: Phosphoserine phosphatase 1 [Actinomycetota bacterium]